MAARASTRPNISLEELSKVLDQSIASLDPERAGALDRLRTARKARGAGYLRERKRLALKYGADDPRTEALAVRAQFNQGLRRDLDFEVARAQTETPVPGKGGYVFHGFVRDLKGQGVAGLTVALYDAKGTWLREFGHGSTDERGYFLLRFEPRENGEEPRPPEPKGVLDPSGKAAAAEAKAATRAGTARIHVLDEKGTTLHIEKEPLSPQLGEVDFQIILLGSKDKPSPPPPEKKPGENETPKRSSKKET